MGDRLVLGYHAVSETWPAALAIEPERLDAQLASLVQRGFRGATFTEVVTARRSRKTVAVTFDDGFHSVIEHGLPILSRYGLVGTVFVATDHVGRETPMDWPVIDRWIGGPHEHELLPLSWAELARLAAAGWEIASHTRSHPRLTDLDDEALHEELGGSRDECEQRLGVSYRSLAYPYGVVDRRVMVATRRAGYVAGATLPARIHRTHRYRWPRVGVWHNDPPRVWEAKLSPLSRRRLDLRTGLSGAIPQWQFGAQ